MINFANSKGILEVKDFEGVFGEPMSEYVKSKILEHSFSYEEIHETERDASIRKIVSTLLDQNIVKSGEHRLDQWESGWNENLLKFKETDNRNAIIPQYFGKYGILRFKQRFIRPISPDFEYNILGILLDWLFDKYMRHAKTIYEFGCGTGHNLLRVRNVNADAILWGLDWVLSSQKIIEEFVTKGVRNIYGQRFDYFNPDYTFKLEKNSIIYTVASLEQIGDRFESFISYLIKNRPALCVHIEPISELLDENNLIDYLSIVYFKSRKYLKGFYSHLKNLESNGVISVEFAKRTHIGSFYIEGYSVIVWKPI